MPAKIYYPFQQFNFSNRTCFLSGEPLSGDGEKIQVFPQWLMNRYNLREQPFKLLDESYATYKDLKIPCSSEVNEQYLEALESEISAAFDGGFDALNSIDKVKLFQWAGKLLYGILFNEVQAGLRQQHAEGQEFNISQALIHKFSNLHLMLQSITQPVVFEGFVPFSLFLFKVNNPEDLFGYRDEINTLTFSLRIKDFGLIICLQDNGANRAYHKAVLEKMDGQMLHPIQFEEFNARIFYSAYLFNRLPEYHVLPAGEQSYIDAMPLRGISNKPLFDFWQNKTYGQVLENFWKKWGFVLLEIIKDPENPMSFLLDAGGRFINASAIELPR